MLLTRTYDTADAGRQTVLVGSFADADAAFDWVFANKFEPAEDTFLLVDRDTVQLLCNPIADGYCWEPLPVAPTGTY